VKPTNPANITNRQPRAGACADVSSAILVSNRLDGIPQRIFLQLIAGDSRLIRP
jgi:hypothetical protein